jgi:3-phosphoshikimate 1-carboxyvinyltransferase
MTLQLSKSEKQIQKSEIIISGSKSETNRLLILQALYPNISIGNLSNADDCKVVQNAFSSKKNQIDIHHAGTAMRFLTAFYAQNEGSEIVLTGSERMKERPISILVDALRTLGSEIDYIEKEGFPPLKIKGKKLTINKVTLAATVSSQYISALLLIAPKLENGLEIELIGEITSMPYIKMTLALLNQIGVQTLFENNCIKVWNLNTEVPKQTIDVESDWSSASYFYSVVALSAVGTAIKLSNYKKDSLQGDKVLVEIYSDFGVTTTFENNFITIEKTAICHLKKISYDLKSSPDLAQTIAVTCFGLDIACDLTGLHTLKIKETDRLLAMKTELEKLEAKVEITNESLHLEKNKINNPKSIAIATYNDHRMAMSFAPLALKFPVAINDTEVVSKSYPNFWTDMKTVGIDSIEI